METTRVYWGYKDIGFRVLYDEEWRAKIQGLRGLGLDLGFGIKDM